MVDKSALESINISATFDIAYYNPVKNCFVNKNLNLMESIDAITFLVSIRVLPYSQKTLKPFSFMKFLGNHVRDGSPGEDKNGHNR